MLYLVGLGLADERDISVKGLDVVKSAHRVYLEAYTSILLVDKEKLVPPSRLCGHHLTADRQYFSRKLTMVALLPSPIVKWSSPAVMRSWRTPIRKTWLS